MIGRRAFVGTLGAGLATLGAGSAGAQERTAVNVGAVLEDDSCAVLYGAATGVFDRLGLDLHIQRMASGSVTTAAVVSGALQIGKSSTIALIAAHARGIPIVIIAPSAISTPQAPLSVLLVAIDSPLRSGKDFNGKTFGVAALIDARVLAAKAWVDANGGDAQTLKFVEIPPPEAVAALSAGRIDATIATNPILTAALASGKVRRIAEPNLAVAPRFVVNTWFATVDYVSRNRDLVRRFCAGLRTAGTYANAHPREMATYLAPFSGLDLATLRATPPTAIGIDLLPGEYQPVIDDAAKYGFIDKTFPARDFLLTAA